MTTDAGMLELIEIEALLEGEAGCQANHNNGEGLPCSVTVMHRYIVTGCENIDKLVCGNVARHVARSIHLGILCLGCDEPIADHWQVIPV